MNFRILNDDVINAIEDVEKSIELSKAYTNIEEMLEDLKKED